MMKYCTSIFVIAVVLLSIGIVPAAAAEPGGTVVVARPDGDALILWDVSSLVTKIVADKTPREDALRSLESQAIDVMSSRVATLQNAKTVSVRVIYLHTGAVDPRYAAATLAGVERIFTIEAPASKVGSEAASWSKGLLNGQIPKDVVVTTTGALPPP